MAERNDGRARIEARRASFEIALCTIPRENDRSLTRKRRNVSQRNVFHRLRFRLLYPNSLTTKYNFKTYASGLDNPVWPPS